MDIAPEYLFACEAFLFSSIRQRVMNTIGATQRIVSDDAGAVKTMPANHGPLFSKQAIVREFHIGVSEMNQRLGHLDSDRKYARHGITLPFNRCQFFRQVHQPATLGVDWLVRFRKFTNVLEQTAIAAKGCGVQLWVSATEIECVKTLWQHGVGERTELHNFGAILAQEVEIVLVIERECLIAGDSDADAFVLWFSAMSVCILKPLVARRRVQQLLEIETVPQSRESGEAKANSFGSRV